jgi:hypothetical protein
MLVNPKVGRVRLYHIEQAEYIQANNMNALQILLYRQQFVQRFVGCRDVLYELALNLNRSFRS